MLLNLHPLTTDGDLEFDEDSHVYTLRGKQVPTSVTPFLAACLSDEKFDGDAVISKHLRFWRSNASSRYYNVVKGRTDEEAITEIKKLWNSTAQRGTKLHAILEDMCNHINISTSDKMEYATELDQYHHFHHDFGWSPFRTELCVAATKISDPSSPALAGSIDALYSCEEDDGQIKLYMVDYKRTPKNLEKDAYSFGKYAKHPVFRGHPLNDHLKYACQLATYRILLEKFANIHTDGAYILQLHKDIRHYNLIPVTDFRTEMRLILAENDVDVSQVA